MTSTEAKGEQVDDDNAYLNPIFMNTLGNPQDHDLLQTYEVYRPSLATRKLLSEQGRTLYAEVLIDNPRLGPLRDLCVAALGKVYKPNELQPEVRNDKVKMRLYYDALSSDLPLEKCHFITDSKYWQRVVLEKSSDKTFKLKKSYDWRSLGLSLKFVDLVEACAAEYWPENEMKPEIELIKDFVTEMHIRHLQSLTDAHFEKYFIFESEESDFSESDSTDVASFHPTPISTETSENSSLSTNRTEEVDVPQNTEPEIEAIPNHKSIQSTQSASKIEITEEMNKQLEYDEIREARRQKILKAQEEQRERRRAREERRRVAETSRPSTPLPEPEPVKGKKIKKFQPKGVLDIPIEPDSDDGKDKFITDRRNKERYLKRIKKYKYPARDCHHISLRFLRFFENLTIFTIEFAGPKMLRDFHERHLRFSYKDIENLAFGISYLEKLQVFRLRKSQMDIEKLDTLAKALTTMPSLEVVDFGYDTLEDDCGIGLYELFRHSKSIKSLELEYNFLSAQSMHFLGMALRYYAGTLDYLGLAGNPLGADALGMLCEKIRGTNHITHLCIRGTNLTDNAIISSVVGELLRYPQLRYLDISAVRIGVGPSVEMLKVLQNNTTIMQLDCRGCDMDLIFELDIMVILRRNRYMEENPYVGNAELTAEEVDAVVGRVKNPIYLRAIEAVKKRAECLQNRPDIISLDSKESCSESVEFADTQRSLMSLDKPKRRVELEDPKGEEEECEEEISVESCVLLAKMPFFYDTSNFTEPEFHKHVFLPGPGERYDFFNPPPPPLSDDGETRNA